MKSTVEKALSGQEQALAEGKSTWVETSEEFRRLLGEIRKSPSVSSSCIKGGAKGKGITTGKPVATGTWQACSRYTGTFELSK